MNDAELSTLIQQHAQRHAASQRLRAAVQTQITLHAATQPAPPGLAHPWRLLAQRLVRASGNNPAMHLGLGYVAGVVLTLAMLWALPRALPPAGGLAGELINLHVHATGAGPLFQVASSDRHTVKPWFQGKLDYAPEVADLSEAGFALLGGRIERVQGRDTAVLTYQWRKHFISAYVMPQEQAAPLERLQQRGFHLAHWSDGVMQVWALSDADASELERFGAAWLAATAAAAQTH